MNPFLIDSHTHLQFSAYDNDRAEVLDRAFNENIWIINSGSNSQNSEDAVRLAEKYEKGVYATIGIHPSHALSAKALAKADFLTEESGSENFDEEKMMKLAASPKVVAVGECGLEYFREYNAEAQKKLFAEHIIFANKIKKPLTIHCREAYGDTYDILSAHKEILNERGGLMHFFSGTLTEARKFLDLGYYFSFGGAITLPKKAGGADFEELIRELPFDRILCETDAPFVSPVPYRGRRNEPSYVIEVAKKMAEIRGITLDEVAKQTTENAMRLFAIEA
jgi:TatD DNase family protein